MFSRILVPVDGTPEAASAAPVACALAGGTQRSLTLLQVVGARESALVEAAAAALRTSAAELACGGVPIDSVVRAGDAVEEILAHVRQQRTDLLVMRTHAHAGVSRGVLGSVSEQLLARSGVPVLLIPPASRTLTHLARLLVPTDGTPGSSVALGHAVELARATAARITLVQVSVPFPMQAYAGYVVRGMPYYDPAWDEEAFTSARSYVEAMARRLRDSGVEAEGRAYEAADVPQAIVALAKTSRADLVLISTHALTGPARTLLGSVADAVVRHAPCPVLLMHRVEAARLIDLDADTRSSAG